MSRDVAVHIGIDHLDWQSLKELETSMTNCQLRLSAYAGSGEQANMAAGRMAFTFDLHGASVTFNTACSSALVATHYGAHALRTAECSSVFAAGVKAILLPYAGGGGLYAPDGRCKSFDARADGYGRAEGVARV